MTRRRLILLSALAGLAVAVPAALAGSPGEEKAQVDDKIGELRAEIEEAEEKEGVLSSEIEAVSDDIRALESEIGPLTDRVEALERQLALERERLARLTELHREQTRHLGILVRGYEVAQRRLERRLVELYETDRPDELAIVLQAESLNGLIEQIEYLNQIGRQDRAVAHEIARLREEMRATRARTAATRAEVAKAAAALAQRTAEQRAVRDRLVAEEHRLAEARASKEGLLASVRDDKNGAMEDLEALEAASAELAARIQAAQAAAVQAPGQSPGGVPYAGGAPAGGGFIWPVSGTLTSTFGLRWGRLHSGIDIAAPGGTPIYAAAAGAVIIAGWSGGYGNLVVIDHGNGLATAYAHMSAIYVSGGSVAQGQAIGAVGSTGNSTGNHLHFEVRVNGAAVDPLGYL